MKKFNIICVAVVFLALTGTFFLGRITATPDPMREGY